MIRLGMMISDRYEIEEKVGAGGMSVVYKAKDVKLGRRVAIKVLRDEYCYDDGFVKKFKVEAQAAASLSHPNIVNIYDVGNDDKIHYIVMEYLDGLTLKEHIKLKGILSNSEVIKVGIAIALALQCAHENHIFHRDIKPQNIIMTKDGRIKVADFGIARVATGATIPAADVASGSVHYIPPEQAKGGYTDERSDIYSLGISMFEMITGEVPFVAESAVSVALKQIHDELPDMKTFNEDIDHNLEQIILKATQKRPQMRYESAEDMLMDLRKANNFPEDTFVKIDKIDSDSPTMIMNNTQMRQIWNEKDILDDQKNVADKAVIGGGIFAAAILAGLIFLWLFSAYKNDIVPPTYKVPEVIGKDIEEVNEELIPLTMSYQIQESVYDDTVEKDVVIDQSPPSGTVVGENQVIKVIVSQGQELFTVPDVTSQKNIMFDVAKEKIEDAHLIPVVIQQYDDTLPVGVVIEQSPAAGEALPKEEKVTITVSLGKEDRYVEVPDVKNKPLSEAKSMLEVIGLTVSDNVSEAYNENIKKGNVIAMTVKPGSSVKVGYIIDLTISLGAEIKPTTQVITVNNVLGPDEETALLQVLLTWEDGTKETLYDSYVSHESFDTPIQVEVTGLGSATYEVYKNNILEYTKQIKFTQESVNE